MKNCLLCVSGLHDSKKCNGLNASYIAMHGTSGKSGRVGNANVPKEYRLVTLENSPARNGQERNYKIIEKYVETFNRMFEPEEYDTPKDRIKSLYLFSEETGTGKTTTASAILNEWLIRHFVGSVQRGKQPLQTPAYFLDTNEWQQLYNEFNRSGIPQDVAEKASREFYRRMQCAKDAPFAVFDDIGVRNATEAFRGDLHGLINHRVSNQLPTIYTSNIPIDELEKVYDRRLYDRVRDLCIEVYFDGESKRGLRK